MASAHGSPAHLLGNSYKADVAKWLEEDCPGFDWGGFIVGDAPAEAKLLGKSAVGFSPIRFCARPNRAPPPLTLLLEAFVGRLMSLLPSNLACTCPLLAHIA